MANIDKNASYMDDNSYFVKNHSNSNEKFSETEITKMLEILEIYLFGLGFFLINSTMGPSLFCAFICMTKTSHNGLS